MKSRTSLVILLIGAVTLSLGAWVYFSKNDSFEILDLMQYAIIIVLVAFALMFGIRRLRSARRGEPADDELSLKVLHGAAMISYLVSLNVWAILIYIGSITKVDPFILFGTGILSMVVVFAVSWVIIKTRRYV